MLHASCHCGAVRLEIARKPRTLTECNCSICRRYAARWAYTTKKSVRILSKPNSRATYVYDNKNFEYHFCKHCGCVTHYERINVKNTNGIAVNARMIDPDELGSPPVRSLDVRKKARS